MQPHIRKAQELFATTEETLIYLEENDFLDQSRASLLESLKKNIEAAGVHLNEGRTVEAARVLLSDPDDVEAVSQGRDVVVQGLWEVMSFGNAEHISSPNVEYLIRQASAFPEALIQKVQIFLPAQGACLS